MLLSAVRWPWVTGPAKIWHNFCLGFCCSFQLTQRDALMCVLSDCLLFTFCAAFACERPNSNLQKHTVANCQGWNLYCYLPLCIKKLRLALWCAGIWVLLGTMPPAFTCIHLLSVQLTSVTSLHKWMLSSRHEMVLSLKKNTQHSKTHAECRCFEDRHTVDGDKKVQKSFFLLALFLYSHL